MRRVFRTRTFTRWMKKAGVADADLWAAALEMSQGLVDADLGGHVMKITGRAA
ncbi:MAG: type II toxin-antitoxin system RelE/ParE family toxin [Candidatus Macondimonas sp.]